jgi:chromosome segregation ATPase
MSNQPATPLDNQSAIAQLNRSLNFIVDEIVRPTAIRVEQTTANLDRLEAMVERSARSIDLLRDVADDAAGEVAEAEPRISENEQRFQNLLDEAREDRRRSDERFAEQRRLSDERFNAVMDEIRALGEQNRALLSALASTNGRVDGLERAS